MAIVFLLQLDVANTLRIRTLGNRMLMIVDEFVAINPDTGKRLKESIDRTITYTNYTLIFACNRNFTLKTAVDAAVSFIKLGETMTQQLIFAGKVDVFLAEKAAQAARWKARRRIRQQQPSRYCQIPDAFP